MILDVILIQRQEVQDHLSRPSEEDTGAPGWVGGSA